MNAITQENKVIGLSIFFKNRKICGLQSYYEDLTEGKPHGNTSSNLVSCENFKCVEGEYI